MTRDLEKILRRIAVALEAQAGCTGWLDDHDNRQHDGDTCPVHEDKGGK